MSEKSASEVWRIRDRSDYLDHMSATLLYSPDRFRPKDFLQDHQQLTFDLAYKLLVENLDKACPPRSKCHARHGEILEIIEESRQFYLAGDEYNGAHRLQDAEDIIRGRKSYV